MATDPNLHRIVPIQGGEIARRRLEDHGGTGANQMQAGEVHTSVDALGFARHFVAHKHVGGYLHHGDVATEGAMLALDNPGLAHACMPGDTCRRTDLGAVMLCISGRGTLAGHWVPLVSTVAVSAAAVAVGAIAGLSATEVQAALAELMAGKAASSHTHAQSEITGLVTALAGKWATPANAAALALLGVEAGTGYPTWDGELWPTGGGSLSPYESTPPAAERTYAFTEFGAQTDVIFAIATMFGALAWAAPGQSAFASTGKVGCLLSSSTSGSGVDLVDRATNGTVTNDTANSWAALDIGGALKVSDYVIRNRSTANHILRNWKLQGCNTAPANWSVADVAAMAWEDIETRTNDTTLPNTASAWGRFVLSSPSTTAYRFFRILQNGLNSTSANYLALAEVELYGVMSSPPKLPAGARGWLSDGAGRYVPWY